MGEESGVLGLAVFLALVLLASMSFPAAWMAAATSQPRVVCEPGATLDRSPKLSQSRSSTKRATTLRGAFYDRAMP